MSACRAGTAGKGGLSEPTTPLNRLLARATTLPPTGRMLARYVLANHRQVAFATVAELAAACGVSQASVVRFAIALGFPGYPAFQREIRRIVRADLDGPGRLALAESAAPPDTDALATAMRQERTNIAALAGRVEPAALRAAAGALRSAPEIIVAGARCTAALATHLWFALDTLRLPARCLTVLGPETEERVARLCPGAACVVITFPRYLRSLVALATAARARGATAIAITDSPFAPVAADIRLHAPAESASFIAFHAAPLILINALIEEVARADRAATRRALAEFESLALRGRYFQRS